MQIKIKLITLLFSVCSIFSCTKETKTSLISYVDPMIGTGAADTPSSKKNQGDHVDFGQTIPAISTPFGMTQWTPKNRETEQKCVAPFYMDREIIQGFGADRRPSWLLK